MNSKLIDRDMRYLTDRCKQTKWKENTVYPANGKIDQEFKQGDYLGDCWLIAAVKSLSATPKGQEMLDDIMSIDKKGNVTVKLKGVQREYTISKEELEGANELAQGDLDVRAIEIAIRRYLNETGDQHNLLEKIKNRFNGSKIRVCEYDMYHGMHDLSRPYNMLFGKPLIHDARSDESTIDKIKTGKYSVVVSSNNSYSLNNYDFVKCHVYAVTGADNKYIYLSTPGRLSNKLKLSHANFLKFFNASYSVQLSD